jgi:hypothetical protein
LKVAAKRKLSGTSQFNFAAGNELDRTQTKEADEGIKESTANNMQQNCSRDKRRNT